MPTALAGVSSKTARRRVATSGASDFAQYPVWILAGIMVRVRSSRASASATHTESRRGMYKVAYSAADAQSGCLRQNLHGHGYQSSSVLIPILILDERCPHGGRPLLPGTDS